MRLNHLAIEQFRIYPSLKLDIPETGLRVAGRNGSGKSSLLEAIVMLSTTRSPRAGSDRDVVAWESGEEYGVPPYSRLTAKVSGEHGSHDIGIALSVDPNRSTVARKQFLLDQRSVRAHTLIGTLKTVLFSPEDVELVSGAPSERRRQVDILISQIDRSYLQRLSRYTRILTQRNGLLRRFAQDGVRPGDHQALAELSYWDEELVAGGAYVVAGRVKSSALLAKYLAERSRFLIDGAEIGFGYAPKLKLPTLDADWPMAELVQHIGVALRDQLAEARTEEFRRGVSVIGPHRDDFQFDIDGRELGRVGSRGQQRLGVVAYKLAESDVVQAMTGDRPMLLLDDVLSELDVVHQEMLLSAVAQCECQVIVTATEDRLLDHSELQALPMLTVDHGTLTPIP